MRSLLSATGWDVRAFAALRAHPEAFDATRVLVQYRREEAPRLEAAGIVAGTPLGAEPGLREVVLPEGVDVASAIAGFLSDPSVVDVQPNYVVQVAGGATPNDPRFADGSLWAMNNTGQAGGTSDADIDAPAAWEVTTGTGRTIVAVIDTGIDWTHPDLAANLWVNAGEIPGDGIDNDGNGYVDDVHGYDFRNRDGDPRDDNGHGTHVAGTIGAVGDNGIGVAGVAWDVQIMALKFLGADGRGYLSDAILALDYAVSMGATVSNHSYAFGGSSSAFADAIARAGAAGHIVVAGAGNNGRSNDLAPTYPASYDLENVVSVASTDRNDARAGSSNYGEKSVDLGAPGVGIVSTTRGGKYGTMSGTSMATPHVTGAIALVWDAHPDWTYDQVIGRVLETVDPIPALAGKTVTGGRLNVGRALADAGKGQGIDFGSRPILRYAGTQDGDGDAVLEDHGATLRLVGNTWKAVAYPYTVTDRTWLALDVRIPALGEIHGIALATELTETEARTFQLAGSQKWGFQGHRVDPDAAAAGWVHLEIPVGQYPRLRGPLAYLGFVMDHDVARPDAQTAFRNVRLYEKGPATAASVDGPPGSLTPARLGAAVGEPTGGTVPVAVPPRAWASSPLRVPDAGASSSWPGRVAVGAVPGEADGGLLEVLAREWLRRRR